MDRRWATYWRHKKARAKQKGIDFDLTTEEIKYLSAQAPVFPSRKKGGVHLGRKDHSRGYSIDNVEWQSVSFNTGEPRTRKVSIVYEKCKHCGKKIELYAGSYKSRRSAGQENFFCSLDHKARHYYT